MEHEKTGRDPEVDARRRQSIRIGMRKAAQAGRSIGRPRGKESVEKVLSKSYSRSVRVALEAGLSLREVARVAGVCVNTVRKVKAALNGDVDTPYDYET